MPNGAVSDDESLERDPIRPGVYAVCVEGRFTIVGVVAIDGPDPAERASLRLRIRTRGAWWVVEHLAAERSVPVPGRRSDTGETLDAIFVHLLLRLEEGQADLLLPVWDSTEALPADLVDVVRDSSGTGEFDARALQDDYAGVVEAIRDANEGMRHKEVLMPEEYVPEPDALLIRFAFLGESLGLTELLDAWAQAKPAGPLCEAPLLSGEQPTTLELVLDEDTRVTGLRLCLGVPGRDVAVVRWHDGERWTTDIPQLKPAVRSITGIDPDYQDVLIRAVRTTAHLYEPINSILRRYAAAHQIRASALDQDVYQSVHDSGAIPQPPTRHVSVPRSGEAGRMAG